MIGGIDGCDVTPWLFRWPVDHITVAGNCGELVENSIPTVTFYSKCLCLFHLEFCICYGSGLCGWLFCCCSLLLLLFFPLMGWPTFPVTCPLHLFLLFLLLLFIVVVWSGLGSVSLECLLLSIPFVGVRFVRWFIVLRYRSLPLFWWLYYLACALGRFPLNYLSPPFPFGADRSHHTTLHFVTPSAPWECWNCCLITCWCSTTFIWPDLFGICSLHLMPGFELVLCGPTTPHCGSSHYHCITFPLLLFQCSQPDLPLLTDAVTPLEASLSLVPWALEALVGWREHTGLGVQLRLFHLLFLRCCWWSPFVVRWWSVVTLLPHHVGRLTGGACHCWYIWWYWCCFVVEWSDCWPDPLTIIPGDDDLLLFCLFLCISRLLLFLLFICGDEPIWPVVVLQYSVVQCYLLLFIHCVWPGAFCLPVVSDPCCCSFILHLHICCYSHSGISSVGIVLHCCSCWWPVTVSPIPFWLLPDLFSDGPLFRYTAGIVLHCWPLWKYSPTFPDWGYWLTEHFHLLLCVVVHIVVIHLLVLIVVRPVLLPVITTYPFVVMEQIIHCYSSLFLRYATGLHLFYLCWLCIFLWLPQVPVVPDLEVTWPIWAVYILEALVCIYLFPWPLIFGDSISTIVSLGGTTLLWAGIWHSFGRWLMGTLFWFVHGGDPLLVPVPLPYLFTPHIVCHSLGSLRLFHLFDPSDRPCCSPSYIVWPQWPFPCHSHLGWAGGLEQVVLVECRL